MYIETKEKSNKASKYIDSNNESKAILNLLCSVSKKMSSESRVTQLLNQTINMTQKTLNATAASIMLFDESDKELYFEAASGPVGKELKRVKIDAKTGIAGHVARTGKSLIVNDVRKHPSFQGKVDDMTGFITSSMICAPLTVHRKILGVIEVLNKADGSDFNTQDLESVEAVASTTAMAIENTRLHQDIVDAYKATITTLAAAIDAKDPYTHGHSKRVMEYAMIGGKNLSLSKERLEALEYAALLHDIGKISIDAHILNKPAVLNSYEWQIMRLHPQTGYNMLKEIPFLEKSSKCVLYHHERFDGEGYPEGIKGQDIPLEARLISVADAFDTMTTDRSYRPAMSVEESLERMYDCSRTQFCPVALEAVLSNLSSSIEVSQSSYT